MANNKLKLTGQNLCRIFNSRCGRAFLRYAIRIVTKTQRFKIIKIAIRTCQNNNVLFYLRDLALGFICSPRYSIIDGSLFLLEVSEDGGNVYSTDKEVSGFQKEFVIQKAN